jgi:molybdopterin molybdotransferase
MIAIQEALSIIQRNQPSSRPESVELSEAGGRILAGDILAPEPSPRYTNSAMDGFALRWEDLSQTSTQPAATLHIIGESRAGKSFLQPVAKGQAIRISTGAMLPATCDTVVRVEDTTVEGGNVVIRQVRKKKQDIRFMGEEFEKGEVLLQKHTTLYPPQLALLASVGISEVQVYRRPEVAVLVTGSELVAWDDSAAPDQIRDSNTIMLKTAVELAGGVVTLSAHVEDSKAATVRAIEQVMAAGNILLFSGGVSVGRHDHVKAAALSMGFTQLFWRIRQKPGKPLFFARRDDCLLFGLPGNPVSAFMCFSFYVQPLIGNMLGSGFSWRTVRARTPEDIVNPGERVNFMRVRLFTDDDGATSFGLTGGQGSHMLTSIARADGFIIVDAGKTIAAQSWLDVYLLPWK